MNCLVARYAPSRRYLSLAVFAAGGVVLSAWTGLRFSPVWIAAALFGISSAGMLFLALRPVVEIHETHLKVGRRVIPWGDVRRLDHGGWSALLAVRLTLAGDRQMLLLYPGELDTSASLLRHLRRYSREALLDGLPYRQFWGEPPKPAKPREAKPIPPARYPVLRPEDEEEVERMFQRLKSVGRLDPRGSDARDSDEK